MDYDKIQDAFSCSSSSDSAIESKIEDAFSSSSDSSMHCSIVISNSSDPDYNNEQSPITDQTSTSRRSSFVVTVRSGLDMVKEKCCSSCCLQQFSIDRLNEIENEIKNKSFTAKRTFLMDSLKKQCKWSFDEMDLITQLFVDRHPVCLTAYKLIYDISDYVYNDIIQKAIKNSHCRSIHGNTGLIKLRKGTATVISMLQVFLDENAQHLPNFPHKIVTTFQTKKHVYEYLKNIAQMTNQVRKFITYERFMQLWIEKFPGYQVKKMQGVVYCSTCTRLFDKIRKSKTPEEYKENMKWKDEHLSQVRESYDYFHTICQRARVKKYDQDCIEIDGMDQKKTDLPKFCQEDKDTATCVKLRTHVTGAIVYTDVDSGEMPFLYYDLCQFSHDVNIVINVLLRCLMAKPLCPRSKLHLQLDNTTKENKNKFMMGFCALLVAIDMYDEVILMFHPVGHTHSRVDALFSRVSVALSSSDIGTLSEFHERLKGAQGEDAGQPYVSELKEVFDVKSWMLDIMEHNIDGITNKHLFRFFKKDETVRMKYKNHCIDKDWQPQTSNNDDDDLKHGFVMLKGNPNLSIIPKFLTPSFTLQTTGTLILDVTLLRRQIFNKCAHRLSNDQIAEWTRFFDTEAQARLQVPTDNSEWFIPTLLFSKRPIVSEQLIDQSDQQMVQSVGIDAKILKKLTGGNPMTVGNQGRQRIEKVLDGNASAEISEGTLLGIRPDITNKDLAFPRQNFKLFPWICQARGPVDANHMVDVHWLVGKLNSTWNVEKRGRKRKQTYVSDKIHVNSVYLWGFKLLQNKHLEKTASEAIEKEMNILQTDYEKMYPSSDEDDVEL